ncbi:sensor histidine kinase [Dyadobacter sp. CY343]|uniref:sensor histidine kinase n=1 Tax=Dyadobacter sp. CY343 TaxID=2907299 RepID=UPI001F28CC29|nr:histidine kinase [Dyadobacter sp. CY343]MCE7060611.1 histidine kinase [Dyadobacter sp. CY343]
MKPQFFSKYEWWYHLAMMPVLFAVGNYYFIGPSYFTDLNSFLIGTLIVSILYWISIITLTIIVRWVIARYPHFDQTVRRLSVMLLIVGSVTMTLAVFDVWIYSIMPGIQVAFAWENIWPIMILGGFFDVFLVAMLGLFYSLEQWKKNQAESEKLERLALQHQFDSLKGQVNPHFLFNSLNTLSSLIGEDQDKAENFVEDLAKIYRYTLQAAKTELVTLQAEIGFMRTYHRLLSVRYGESLQLQLPENVPAELHIPPLSLQILIDNSIKYNIMSALKPLKISIHISHHRISIQNNIQAKIRPMGTSQGGLTELKAKYAPVSDRQISIEQDVNHYAVSLPLLTAPYRVNA